MEMRNPKGSECAKNDRNEVLEVLLLLLFRSYDAHVGPR